MNTFKENTHYQINEKEGENLPGTVFTEEFDKVVSILFLKSCQFQMVWLVSVRIFSANACAV